MLAIYDAEGNKLVKSKSLDRTILYYNLLRLFVKRERAKDRNFENLNASDQEKKLDFEMRRLSIVALGMYNRRKLYIFSPELNDDINFFILDKSDLSVSSRGGRPLIPADQLLVVSFLFTNPRHKVKPARLSTMKRQLHLNFCTPLLESF